MIKKIIKRNGAVEDFHPNKVNGWGEWAAKTLGPSIDWTSVVVNAVNKCPELCTSQHLQETLIEECVSMRTWEHNRMAGRLYSALIERVLYDGKRPTIKKLHDQLFKADLMVKLNFSYEEYEEAEKIINHRQDLKYPHYQLNQIRFKYALRNKVTGKEYESAQFVYMRMAMAMAENEKTDKMLHVANWYELLSKNIINPPTPNFVNLGTSLNGYASCCLFTTLDTAASLAAADHIAYMMTCMSAGLGGHIKTRSLLDSVRGGTIRHQGKLPYYRAAVGATAANLQNGRGGALTEHYTAYDPEVKVIQKLRHPTTPEAKRIAGCHYSFGSNKFWARKAARKEKVALFSYGNQPELYEAQYSKDPDLFERLYNEFEATDSPKEYVDAREVTLGALIQSYETGVHYTHQTDTMNKHTPFKEVVYSSNLCQEISEVTKGFESVADLYRPYQEGDGEIALCNIAGIIVSNIAANTNSAADFDDLYAKATYYTLKMIDVCIHKTDYVFPALADTAKARMNAGVGMLGLAHLMAKKHLKYSTQEGRDFIHELSETHYWHLLNASLKLGKELGNAPWMHKTLWPDGWLPLDTYEKKVDELVTVDNKRDWESLRKEIIANGGIRNSVLCAHMPGESSTIAAGTTNGLYPVRELSIMKTNETLVNHWVAPDSTRLKEYYELAWDISNTHMIYNYAIVQKWTDQAISADLYASIKGVAKLSSTAILQEYFDMIKYGCKSRYYINSQTGKSIKLGFTESEEVRPTFSNEEDGEKEEQEYDDQQGDRGCASGVCAL